MALKNNKSFHREYQPGLLNYEPSGRDEDNIYNPVIGSFYEHVNGVNSPSPQTYGAVILRLPANKGLGGNNPMTSGYENGEPRARANHGLVVNGSISLENFSPVAGAAFPVVNIPQSFQYKTLIGWGTWDPNGGNEIVSSNTDFKILSGTSDQTLVNGTAFEVPSLNSSFQVAGAPNTNLSSVTVYDPGEGIFHIRVRLGINMWGDFSSRTYRISGTYYLF